MARNQITANRRQINVWLMVSQIEQLERFTKLYGKDRTALIAEAIQFWLNTQYQLHGEQIEKLALEMGVK